MQSCEFCKHALGENDEADYCSKLRFKLDLDDDMVSKVVAGMCFYYEFIGRHLLTEHCWCQPNLEYVDPMTGNKVWVHNDL